MKKKLLDAVFAAQKGLKTGQGFCDICIVAFCATPCFKNFHITPEEGDAMDCSSSTSSTITG